MIINFKTHKINQKNKQTNPEILINNKKKI